MKLYIFLFLLLIPSLLFAGTTKIYTDEDLNNYRKESEKDNDYINVPEEQLTVEDKQKAYNLCTDMIRSRLKTPSVARFHTISNLPPEKSILYEDGYYVVVGSVDSQNSYGAMLSGGFSCTMYRTKSGFWALKKYFME